MTYNSLIELNEALRPIKNVFCLHTAGGGLEAYKGLAEYFSDKYKFYGVEEPFIFDGFEYQSMQEIAKHHVKVIKTVQNSGPYIVFGYCSGGPIAHEVAHQLRLQGETVESVCTFNRRVFWYEATDKTKYFFLKSYLAAKYGMNFDSIDWELCEVEGIDYLVNAVIQVFTAHGVNLQESDFGWIKQVLISLTLMKNACVNYTVSDVDFDVYQLDKEVIETKGVYWCNFKPSYYEKMDILIEPNFSITRKKVEDFILK